MCVYSGCSVELSLSVSSLLMGEYEVLEFVDVVEDESESESDSSST